MLVYNSYPWSFAKIHTNTVIWSAQQILSASAWSDKRHVTQKVCTVSQRGPRAYQHTAMRAFLYIPTPLKRSQGHSIELPPNSSTPYYCPVHNSHFYMAWFSTYYQKHKCCRDQLRLCTHFRNKTPDSVVFVKLKYHPAHLCSNKPSQENYMPLAIFRTEDFLKSCMQQHFSYTSTFLLV